MGSAFRSPRTRDLQDRGVHALVALDVDAEEVLPRAQRLDPEHPVLRPGARGPGGGPHRVLDPRASVLLALLVQRLEDPAEVGHGRPVALPDHARLEGPAFGKREPHVRVARGERADELASERRVQDEHQWGPRDGPTIRKRPVRPRHGVEERGSRDRLRDHHQARGRRSVREEDPSADPDARARAGCRSRCGSAPARGPPRRPTDRSRRGSRVGRARPPGRTAPSRRSRVSASFSGSRSGSASTTPWGRLTSGPTTTRAPAIGAPAASCTNPRYGAPDLASRSTTSARASAPIWATFSRVIGPDGPRAAKRVLLRPPDVGELEASLRIRADGERVRPVARIDAQRDRDRLDVRQRHPGARHGRLVVAPDDPPSQRQPSPLRGRTLGVAHRIRGPVVGRRRALVRPLDLVPARGERHGLGRGRARRGLGPLARRPDAPGCRPAEPIAPQDPGPDPDGQHERHGEGDSTVHAPDPPRSRIDDTPIRLRASASSFRPNGIEARRGPRLPYVWNFSRTSVISASESRVGSPTVRARR